jgi:ketosteroid isomerase-like protein
MLHSGPMGRAGITLAVLVAVWASVAGCGGGGDDSAAEGVAQDYVDAYNARDFDRVCNLLSDGYKAELLAGSGEEVENRCPAWFEEQTSGAKTTLLLIDVEENGDEASAHIRSRSEDAAGTENDLTLRLIRQPSGDWVIVDLTSASGG